MSCLFFVSSKERDLHGCLSEVRLLFNHCRTCVLVSCQVLDILSLGSKKLQVHELEVVKYVQGKRNKKAETAACA